MKDSQKRFSYFLILVSVIMMNYVAINLSTDFSTLEKKEKLKPEEKIGYHPSLAGGNIDEGPENSGNHEKFSSLAADGDNGMFQSPASIQSSNSDPSDTSEIKTTRTKIQDVGGEEIIEDYVDQISNVDSSADKGSRTTFENEKANDSLYDTLTEALSAETYQLDLEVQWTNIPNAVEGTLCISTGTTAAENILVDAWNGTGWENVFSYLTANAWNNFTITSFLTWDTFTIRYRDGTAGADSTEDSWEIDAVLLSLRVILVEDYVDLKSDVDSSSDLGNHDTFNDLRATDSNYNNMSETQPSTAGNTHSWDAPGGLGNYLQVGSGGSTSFGSSAGTISMWLKFDVIGGRFWGQSGDFELRFAGTGNADLYLDWGVGTGTIYYTHGFTTNKWYFWAITWNENTNTIKVYQGDENNQPTQKVSNTNWLDQVSTTILIENNVMNSRGGSYEVDGHLDDFRYYNTDRSLTAIQNDYKTALTGTESNLVHYYALDNDFIDSAGSANLQVQGTGSFSTDIPSGFTGGGGTGDYQLDLEVRFTGVYDSPIVTEKLCIKTGTFGGSENVNVTYWNGNSWVLITSALISSSWNNYTVPLTSPTFTIKFGGSTTSSDANQDWWEIDSVLIKVEGPERVLGNDYGFEWLDTPDEVDLGTTYGSWVMNHDLSDDSVPDTATGVILTWIEDSLSNGHAVARGSQDTTDYMNGGSINCEIEAETWKMQVVKLGNHRYIDTWRGSSAERLYVMGYTLGADPEFRTVPDYLGRLTADSSWHALTVNDVDESTTGAILFAKSRSSVATTVLVRAVGSTDSMTFRKWESYNSGSLFVKLDGNDQFEYYITTGANVEFYLIAEVDETIDWLDTNRTNISAPFAGWTTRDLDSYVTVPSTASGVILQHESTGSFSDYKNIAREYGKNWVFPSYDVGGGQWLMGGSGIDSEHRIQIYAESTEQDVYIHALTILVDGTPPVVSSFGVDDLGTGTGKFWAVIDDNAGVMNATIKLNETENSMSYNGTHWTFDFPINEFNDYFDYQIWNVTDSLGNSKQPATGSKNHVFDYDVVAPAVLPDPAFITDQDMFNVNVSDTWGRIHTVLVNVTSFSGLTAVMKNTSAGYVNDTLGIPEGTFYYVITVNDTGGNSYTSTQSQGYSTGVKPEASDLTLSRDLNAVLLPVYSNSSLYLNYSYYDQDDHVEFGTEIKWYKKVSGGSVFVLHSTITVTNPDDPVTIPTASLFKGDTWYATVRPRDERGKYGILQTSQTITIRNTPPQVTNQVVSPSNPTNASDLTVSYDPFDSDNDIVTFTIEWYKWITDAYVNQTDLFNKTTIGKGNTTRGEEWLFRIRLYDGANYSLWYQSQPVTIVNTPPEVYGATFSKTVDVLDTDDVDIVYSYSDYDGDDENKTKAIIKWYVNNSYFPDKDNDTTLLSTDTGKGDTWYYEIWVSDNLTYSLLNQSVGITIAFVNARPYLVGLLNVTTTSNNNFTVENLVANYTYFDPNGQFESGTIFVWFYMRGSIEYVYLNTTVTQANRATVLVVPASATRKDDLWWFGVRVKDGISFADNWVNSTSTTPALLVRNSQPVVAGTTITAVAYNLTDLAATWVFSDPDAIDVTGYDYGTDFNITWYVNGTRVPGLDGKTVVEYGNTSRGDTWNFIILVNDTDGQWSVAVNSSFVLIRNSPPVASALVISPVNPYNLTNLVADWTFNDVDNDPDRRTPVYINITWYRNGINQIHLFDNLIVGAGNTTRGETWWYTLRVWDGFNWSVSLYTSPSVTILNSAPVITGKVNITAIAFTRGNSLVLDYTGLFHDDDNDLEQQPPRIRWYKNGILQEAFNDLTAIDGVYVFKGDTWNVSIWVRDIYTYSDRYDSDPVIIVNSLPVIQEVLWSTASPTNLTDLELLYVYDDVDDDPEALLDTIIRWYINGQEIVSNQNQSFLSHILFVRGDKIHVNITPSDGAGYGPSYISSDIIVINSPPIVSSHSILNEENLRTTDELVTIWIFNDNDNDTIDDGWFIIEWYKFNFIKGEYELVPALNNCTEVGAGNTTKKDLWYFRLLVSDGINESAIWYQSVPVYILNSAPAIDWLVINSNVSTAYVNDSLRLYYGFSDADEEMISGFEIFWYVNGSYRPDLSGSSLENLVIDSFILERGAEVYCVYRIYDQDGQVSENKTSLTVIIINSVPEIQGTIAYLFENIDISPSVQTRDFLVEDEELHIDYTFYDNDLTDTDNSTIYWFKNGELQGQLTNMTTIPASATSPGDTWFVMIIPYDGFEFGLTVNSTVITIVGRPVIHTSGYTPQIANFQPEGVYDIWVQTSVAGNSIDEVRYVLTINNLTITLPPELGRFNGTAWVLNDFKLLDVLTGNGYSESYFANLSGTNITVQIIVTAIILSDGTSFDIIRRLSFEFTIEDHAPPRVIEEETGFYWDNDYRPNNITFYTAVQDYGTGVGSVTLLYLLRPVIGNTTGTTTGMSYYYWRGRYYQANDNFNTTLMTFNGTHYVVTIPYVPKSNTEVLFMIQVTDQAGNFNGNAFPDGVNPSWYSDKTFIFIREGIDLMDILPFLLGFIIVLAIISFVAIKKFSGTELVGLDVDMVMERITDINADDISAALDQHTLGVIISFFDQRHGPVPIIIEPEILKDNYNALMELSDNAFSSGRFVNNYEDEILFNFEFSFESGIVTTSITWSFALERPEARGRSENITLNLLVHEEYFSFIFQFIDRFKNAVHDIHVLMDKSPSEKEKLISKIRELRRFVTSIILSYENMYGSIEDWEEAREAS
ncbi:MAG: hypothetical protein ACFFD4_24920 [Candidatus Odinarchaeota archaeon]